ncbi:MAG: ABC-F family ATP-binding cassette domain-containing protein [Flavobacteriales bacterium]|nr:ABC-F family ATP-binding cassette domain-containing protein [Flavobacteriales bacterium]
MNILSVENVSKRYGPRLLFENFSFGMARGEKVAIVAPNGSGKSTLLKAIAGTEPADTGEIVFRGGTRIGYLPQDPIFPEGRTLKEAILESDTPMKRAMLAYEKALKNADDGDALQAAMDMMDRDNAWDYEARVKEVLGQLGIERSDMPVESASGGQRKRAALAKVMLEEPDLLILDEPTNHLDLDTIEWLENWLASGNFTLLMVTHDRYFLDRVCTDILEIDRGELVRYIGNYSYFLEKKAEREAMLAASVDKAKNLFRSELEWMRRMPKARTTKSKSRIGAFDEVEAKASIRTDKQSMELGVRTERMGSKIVEYHKVDKAYGEVKILKDFTYTFKRHEKLGIVGKNGTGKSTFVKMLLGKVEPDAGKVVQGETVRFGHYDQDGLINADHKRVIEVVTEIAEVIELKKGHKLTAAQLLERFLFSRDKQWQLVSTLSGGEKRRLYLCTVLMANPNFLVLDEPTNDLDIDTLQVLEDYIGAYDGCLVVVSHDRFFMDKTVDHLFVFEGQAAIRDFPGNYSQYREKLKEENAVKSKAVAAAKSEAKSEAEASAAPKEKTKLTYGERLEFEKLEKSIEELEARKEALAKKLSETNDNDELMAVSAELEEVVKTADAQTERWMELAQWAE